MKVLSIQSVVAHGHVGNSAAVFPLQRLGVEVVPIPTVNFSNHTGYGAWRGPLLPPSDVAEILLGVEERGVFGQVDAVLSGYQGGTGIADVIIDAVRRVKAANPAALYACDPVMGNAKSGCFVAPEIPVLLRDRVVPLVHLRQLLGVNGDPPPPRRPVIVLEMGERRTGIVVDGMLGQREIVVKGFDAPQGTLPVFSGATIMGDGVPALILDVGGLL